MNFKQQSGRCVRGMWSLLFGAMCLITFQARAQFTSVIQVPPDLVPTFLGSDTQLNLLDRGVLPPHFEVGDPSGATSNVEVNILGGSASYGLHINRNSSVNLSDGTVGDRVLIGRNGTLNISGGGLGDAFRGFKGSEIHLLGRDFRVD